MKKLYYLAPVKLTTVALAAMLLMACGSAAGPAVEPKSAAGTVAPAPLSAWDQLVKEAQKEGVVNIYATNVAPAVVPLREAFRQKFGINLEFVTGRPTEVIAKMTAERRAGLYLASLGHIGETAIITDVKPLGMTIPVSDLLVLPEVKNPKSWIGDQVPFLDKDQHVLMFSASALPQVVVNTDVVKEGDLVSFLDLPNPRWKGKIVLSDPAIPGGSPNILAAMAKVYGKEKVLETLRQLAAQEPVITRDDRMLLEWVARAKYPIGVGYSAALYSEFRRAGAPMKMLSLKEPRHIYGGPGTLAIFSQNPSSKATQVYVNWLLTQEGASIFSKALEYASMRVDVSKEWLEPDVIPRATDAFPDEEQLKLRLEMRELAPRIFSQLTK